MLVETVDKRLADLFVGTTVLTMCGVEARYPGDMAEASEQDVQDNVEKTNQW